jgi:trehalose-phosphatase
VSVPKGLARGARDGETELLIVADLDGTLIAAHRNAPGWEHDVRLLPGFCRRIRALPGVEMACVTGRRAASARRVLAEPMWVIGVHGAETLEPGSDTLLRYELDPAHAAALATLAARLRERCPRGMRLEDKEVVVAVHHPGISTAEATAVLEPLLDWAESRGLHRVAGRGWIEVRPPGLPDKGTALVALVDAIRPRVLAVAGDDHGDAMMFDAAHELVARGAVADAHTAFVAGPGADLELGGRADVVLEGPRQCRAWLLALAEGRLSAEDLPAERLPADNLPAEKTPSPGRARTGPDEGPRSPIDTFGG